MNVSGELKKMVSQSDMVIITVGAKVDDQKKIDYSEVVERLQTSRSGTSSADVLVIYGGVVGFGFN